MEDGGEGRMERRDGGLTCRRASAVAQNAVLGSNTVSFTYISREAHSNCPIWISAFIIMIILFYRFEIS